MCIEYRPFLDLVMNIRSVCVLGLFFNNYLCPPPIVWLASESKVVSKSHGSDPISYNYIAFFHVRS